MILLRPLLIYKSFPAYLTTHDKTIFPRPSTPFLSNTSAGLVLAQMTFQTQLPCHQAQISTFKTPIPPETTTVKPSTVNIQLDPTSIPIIRPKPSIPLSSLTANLTKASNGNLIQPYTIP